MTRAARPRSGRGRAAAWLDLLVYMDPDGLRELLGEGGAFECHRRGVRDVHEPAAWPAVAAVLAGIYGAGPMALVR